MTGSSADTIAAIATPIGEGAVGMVRISGTNVLSLLNGCLRRSSDDRRARVLPARRMMLRHVIDSRTQETVDEVMACWMPGPHSYTGEDTAEIYAHGGGINLSRVLDVFLESGARLAEPGEFTRRAFVNGRIDLARAEAVAQVIGARSTRALRNAQAILRGALGREIATLRRGAISLAGYLEAGIDFADEIAIDEGRRDWPEVTFWDEYRTVQAGIDRLMGTYTRGRYLDGISVALVGRVNAGKSSIFNSLVGIQRAIVSEEAGTTRDYIEREIDWNGQRVMLVDTAGQRDGRGISAVEAAGQQLGQERIDASDIVLRVVDISAPEWLGHAGENLRARCSLLIANKIDRLDKSERTSRLETLQGLRPGSLIATSATTGEGIDKISTAAMSLLGIKCPEAGGVNLRREKRMEGDERFFVTQERHYILLDKARRSLQDGAKALEEGLCPEVVVEHVREGLTSLGAITGEGFDEDVLGAVFSRFCLGK